MKSKIVLLLTLIATACAAQTGAPPTRPATAPVAAIADAAAFKTIGEAINSGATLVSVRPGVYHEALFFTRAVTVEAAIPGTVTIDGGGVLPTLAGGAEGVSLLGLHFINAASADSRGGVEPMSGWLLEDCEIDHCSQAGVDARGSQIAHAHDVTLRRVRSHHNGREGIKGGFLDHSLIDSCESDHNNTAKFPTGGEAGGGKFAQCDNLTFLNYSVHDNAGFGLWLDYKNKNITIRGGSFAGNAAWDHDYFSVALMIEISEGPIAVDGARFTSGPTGSAAQRCGINVAESTGVTITHCVFDGSGIWTRNTTGRDPYHLGPIYAANNTFLNGAIFPAMLPIAATQPATRPATAPATRAASQPTTTTATLPATAPATAPATQAATQPTTRPTSRVVARDADGWTVVSPTGPIRYVDPLNGNDASKGDSNGPYLTFARALKDMKSGGAIGIARDRDLHENFGWLAVDHLDVFAWGDVRLPRPRIWVDAALPMNHSRGAYQSFRDLDFRQLHHVAGMGDFVATAAAGYGLKLESDCPLVEGCSFEGFFQALTIDSGALLQQPVIRRTSFVHNFTTAAGHAQGAYSDKVIGAVWEEDTFDGNGWMPSQPAMVGTGAWMFNHNVYVDDDARPFLPATVRNCIFANAAGSGLQLRPGGTIAGNYFQDNGLRGTDGFAGGDTCLIENNVCTGSLDAPLRSERRGEGLGCLAFAGVCRHNLFVHSQGPRGEAITVSEQRSNGFGSYGPGSSATIDFNTIFDWQGNGIVVNVPRATITLIGNSISGVTGRSINFRGPLTQLVCQSNGVASSNPQPFEIAAVAMTPAQWASAARELSAAVPVYVDSSRTVESYCNTVGLPESGQAFLAAAAANRKGAWDVRFTAASIDAYFFQGFSSKAGN